MMTWLFCDGPVDCGAGSSDQWVEALEPLVTPKVRIVIASTLTSTSRTEGYDLLLSSLSVSESRELVNEVGDHLGTHVEGPMG